jgi:hypothetical protein
VKEHWNKPESEWTDDELLSGLRERYEPTEVPPCSVCGGPLTLASCGGGRPNIWGCSPETGVVDWDHYSQSRWEDYRSGGDSEVMELIRRYSELVTALDELVTTLRHPPFKMVDIKLPGTLATLRMRVSDLLPKILNKLHIDLGKIENDRRADAMSLKPKEET